MGKYTVERHMGFNQHLGMAALKTAVTAFLENGVNFQITTQEAEGCITKVFSRLPLAELKDGDGRTMFSTDFHFYVTEFAFRLYKDGDTKVLFYNGDDEILEVSDRYEALDYILSTFCI